jgi:hypothetical protein
VESEFDERVRALQIEFLADAGAVIFDCARADAEPAAISLLVLSSASRNKTRRSVTVKSLIPA